MGFEKGMTIWRWEVVEIGDSLDEQDFETQYYPEAIVNGWYGECSAPDAKTAKEEGKDEEGGTETGRKRS